jgi:hypothetical protein
MTLNKLTGIEAITKEAFTAPLKNFCYFAGDDDFIEVTEWYNGEGFDILFSTRNGDKSISLSHGEIRALIVLINSF